MRRPSRFRHRGFVLLAALGVVALVAVAIVALAGAASSDGRRTAERATEAQLEQMLLAAAGEAPSNLDATVPAVGEAWTIELPPALSGARSAAILRTMVVSVADDGGVVLSIRAQLDDRSSGQTITLARHPKGWGLISAELAGPR